MNGARWGEQYAHVFLFESRFITTSSMQFWSPVKSIRGILNQGFLSSLQVKASQLIVHKRPSVLLVTQKVRIWLCSGMEVIVLVWWRWDMHSECGHIAS